MTDADTQTFALSDILAVTTGRLLSLGLCGAQKLMEFMLGSPIWTHEMGAASDACKASIVEQLPFVAGINGDDVTTENWAEQINAWEAEHGREHKLHPVPSGHAFDTGNPVVRSIETLATLVGRNKEASQ